MRLNQKGKNLLLLYLALNSKKTLNFLAHFYLSKKDPELMIGGFIADSVKGSKYKQYSKGITKGILLHRAIDDYTDTHEIVTKSVNRIREKHGKYSRVVMDVFYDHFLAKNWKEYSAISLADFVKYIHQLTSAYTNIMPEESKLFYNYMIKTQVLVSYQDIESIDNVLKNMARRTKFSSGMEKAGHTLVENYNELNEDFHLFFKEIIYFVETWDK